MQHVYTYINRYVKISFLNDAPNGRWNYVVLNMAPTECNFQVVPFTRVSLFCLLFVDAWQCQAPSKDEPLERRQITLVCCRQNGREHSWWPDIVAAVRRRGHGSAPVRCFCLASCFCVCGWLDVDFHMSNLQHAACLVHHVCVNLGFATDARYTVNEMSNNRTKDNKKRNNQCFLFLFFCPRHRLPSRARVLGVLLWKARDFLLGCE